MIKKHPGPVSHTRCSGEIEPPARVAPPHALPCSAALGLGAANVDELHADVRGVEAEELVEVDPAWLGLGLGFELGLGLGFGLGLELGLVLG